MRAAVCHRRNGSSDFRLRKLLTRSLAWRCADIELHSAGYRAMRLKSGDSAMKSFCLVLVSPTAVVFCMIAMVYGATGTTQAGQDD